MVIMMVKKRQLWMVIMAVKEMQFFYGYYGY